MINNNIIIYDIEVTCLNPRIYRSDNVAVSLLVCKQSINDKNISFVSFLFINCIIRMYFNKFIYAKCFTRLDYTCINRCVP